MASGSILGHYPKDIGKQIHCGGSTVTLAKDDDCDDCDREAVVAIQGETDSFGFELILLCQACHDRMTGQVEQYETAEGVEEREPREGHKFVVSECTNHDGHGDWFATFDSFKEATGYYREIANAAAPYCGLYPGKGVQEWTLDRIRHVRFVNMVIADKEAHPYSS